jgi:hypothetical protein
MFVAVHECLGDFFSKNFFWGAGGGHLVIMSFVKIETGRRQYPHYNINKKFIYIYSEPVPPLPMFILTNDK